MASDNKEEVPESSLKIESIIHLIEQPPQRPAPRVKQTSPLPVVQRYQLKSSKFREDISQFLTTRKDSSGLNVVIDILMVVFGLGATAAILAVVVSLIRFFAGTG